MERVSKILLRIIRSHVRSTSDVAVGGSWTFIAICQDVGELLCEV